MRSRAPRRLIGALVLVASGAGCAPQQESEEALRLRLALLQEERRQREVPPASETPLPPSLAAIEASSPQQAIAQAREALAADPALRDQLMGPAGDRGGARESSVSPTPRFAANATDLRYSNWLWIDPADANRWQSLTFGDGWIVVRASDEPALAAVADDSGFAPECLGVGMCVLVIDANLPVARHFIFDGERLRPVECIRFPPEAGPMPSDDALRERSNMVVAVRTEEVLCMRHEDAPAFRRVPGALPVEGTGPGSP